MKKKQKSLKFYFNFVEHDLFCYSSLWLSHYGHFQLKCTEIKEKENQLQTNWTLVSNRLSSISFIRSNLDFRSSIDSTTPFFGAIFELLCCDSVENQNQEDQNKIKKKSDYLNFFTKKSAHVMSFFSINIQFRFQQMRSQ